LNRRNFVKLTGASLTSLLIPDFMLAEPWNGTTMQMPDRVKIITPAGTFAMRSTDQHAWQGQDVEVRLKNEKARVAVFVESPATALQEVQLSWKYAIPKHSKVAGDAWERTYADVSFEMPDATRKLPWYCVEHNDNATVCFGVKTGCSAFCYWTVSNNTLTLHLDTRNGSEGVLLGPRILHAADIVTTKNVSSENVFATVSRFCGMLCEEPRRVEQPVYGINDWYFAYGNNSARLILEHTALLAPLALNTTNRPFSVIDDGWSVGSDYTRANDKFGDMPKLIKEISNLGMRPGLWTRPLLARPNEKSTWLIKGRGQVLDPTIDESREFVCSLFRLYRTWGFELVKHDYTTFDIFGRWGKEMNDIMTAPGWHFNDRSKTNAEVILDLYKAIRVASGDMCLIGCNSISHLSAGLFEVYRTGDDTSGKEWIRTKEMGVNTMGFRMVQHRHFYQVDGDCVGVTTAIPWEKNKQWMQLLAQSSAPFFISAQTAAVGAEQKAFIKECFSQASVNLPIGEPLDWVQNKYPAKWKLNNQVVEFDWD